MHRERGVEQEQNIARRLISPARRAESLVEDRARLEISVRIGRGQRRIAQVVSRDAFWRAVSDPGESALRDVDRIIKGEVFFQLNVPRVEFVLQLIRPGLNSLHRVSRRTEVERRDRGVAKRLHIDLQLPDTLRRAEGWSQRKAETRGQVFDR